MNSILADITEQRTLCKAFTLKGVGLHTGAECKVCVTPADPDTGRVFVAGGVEIPARADCVIDTARSTSLGLANTQVRTVEHLLAALAGCLIDNVRIEVVGPEVPILDGSSLPFVESIFDAGVCSQRLPAPYISVMDSVVVQNDSGVSRISATPADACEFAVETSFPEWPEGNSTATILLEADCTQFQQGIAPARTFAFANEVDLLLESGLARGGSIDNVLIITPPNSFSTALRMPGEWWRHKVLDLIGDLALTDARLKCSIKAVRPGHAINTRLAAALISKRIAASHEL